jgi:hypothetical protein
VSIEEVVDRLPVGSAASEVPGWGLFCRPSPKWSRPLARSGSRRPFPAAPPRTVRAPLNAHRSPVPDPSRVTRWALSVVCARQPSRSACPGTCRPSPCARLSRAPWPVVTPPTTMAAPSPWPSQAVGDPVVRRHPTAEAELGAPLIPLLDLIGQCLSPRRCVSIRFLLRHGGAAVIRRFFCRVLTLTTGDWGSSSLAFTMSAGSNATCRTAPSGRRALLPACSCPVGLSASGKLVAQTLPSSVSRLSRGWDDAPHGAHRTGYFRIIRLSSHSCRQVLARLAARMHVDMTGPTEHRRLSMPRRHHLDPVGFRFLPFAMEVAQVSDVMHLDPRLRSA